MKRLFCGFALMIVMSSGALSAAPAASEEPASAVSGNAIPFKKDDPGMAAAAGRTLTTLAVVLGVAVAGMVLIKKYLPQMGSNFLLSQFKGASNRRLKVIETLRLNAKTSLYLVQLDGTTLLLAGSGDTVTTIIGGIPVNADQKKSQEAAPHA